MIIDPVDGWLLHKTPVGDSSVYLTCFTRDQGLLSARYQGGRTPKKQALLHPFTPLWFSLDKKRGYFYVRSLEQLKPSLVLEKDALFSGLYLNELLVYALKAGDAYPQLYDAYIQTLIQLGQLPDRTVIECVLRRFEWTLLTLCGYGFDLSCDCRTGEALQGDQRYRLVRDEGLVIAQEGFNGAHLMAMSQDDLSAPEVLITAKKIMRLAIDHLINGRVLVSRRLYTSHPS